MAKGRRRKRAKKRMVRFGPRYRVPFRRRREGKTNYHLRRKMISGRRPRLVVRVSNKHVLAQVIIAKREGDVTTTHARSQELSKFGWKASGTNLSAAYLVGMLIGKRTLAESIDNLVLDIGLAVPVYGSRVFAVLKGAVDAGLQVAHSDVVFPSEERVRGLHIASHAEQLSQTDEEAYNRQFGRYISVGLKPEEFEAHFDQTRQNLLDNFGKQ